VVQLEGGQRRVVLEFVATACRHFNHHTNGGVLIERVERV
jgi:hypothetical protein